MNEIAKTIRRLRAMREKGPDYEGYASDDSDVLAVCEELERRSAEVSMLRYQLRAADDRADMRTQELKEVEAVAEIRHIEREAMRSKLAKYKWRACVDTLPEIYQWVLVRSRGEAGADCFNTECREKHAGSRDGWRWFSGDEDITHWMPIPEFGEKE